MLTSDIALNLKVDAGYQGEAVNDGHTFAIGVPLSYLIIAPELEIQWDTILL